MNMKTNQPVPKCSRPVMVSLPITGVKSAAMPAPKTSNTNHNSHGKWPVLQLEIEAKARVAAGVGGRQLANNNTTRSNLPLPVKWATIATPKIGAFEGAETPPLSVAAPQKVVPLTIVTGSSQGQRTYTIINANDQLRNKGAAIAPASAFVEKTGNSSTTLLVRTQPKASKPPSKRQREPVQQMPVHTTLLNGSPLALTAKRSLVSLQAQHQPTENALSTVTVVDLTDVELEADFPSESVAATPSTFDGRMTSTLAMLGDSQLLKQQCVGTIPHTQQNTDQNGGSSNSSTKENSPIDNKVTYLLEDLLEVQAMKDDAKLCLDRAQDSKQLSLLKIKQPKTQLGKIDAKKDAIGCYAIGPRVERSKSLGQVMVKDIIALNDRRHSTTIEARDKKLMIASVVSAGVPAVKTRKKSFGIVEQSDKSDIVANGCIRNNGNNTANGADYVKIEVDEDDISVEYIDCSGEKSGDTNVNSEDGTISIISLKTEDEDSDDFVSNDGNCSRNDLHSDAAVSDCTASNNNNNNDVKTALIEVTRETQEAKGEKNERQFKGECEEDNELETSLLCDEQISIASTSPSVLSAKVCRTLPPKQLPPSPPQHATPTRAPELSQLPQVLQLSLRATASEAVEDKMDATSVRMATAANTYMYAHNMVSHFNMLTWKERVGAARGTKLSFQLNEFNLLELHESCSMPRNVYTAFERPIKERPPRASSTVTDAKNNSGLPSMYRCRRCKIEGAVSEFLAPEFCSMACLKRDIRKRRHDPAPNAEKPKPANVERSDNLKKPSNAALSTDTTAVDVDEDAVEVKPPPKYFRWSTYLAENNDGFAAPVHLFLNPFPSGRNNFEVGMKLEAIDPENCSLFCVCTVAAVQGYRLRLHFDGYDAIYDFWVNADSMDIFPVGWCDKTKRILQPPKGYTASKFSWSEYLTKTKAVPANRQLFTHLNSSTVPARNPFKIGMHLEAEDLNDTGKLCVATVADVLDDRVRVHFDGWDDCYDYWVEFSSPYIHPCGWHAGNQQLIVPPDYETGSFDWASYIRRNGTGTETQADQFVARDPIDFKTHMKLEVVDPRNPTLIRPASVIGRHAHRIKLHLDCWPSDYCFWLEDDSPDLHPIGWCDMTAHDLEPPPPYRLRTTLQPCSIAGCRGIGNAKSLLSEATHTTIDCCPYAPVNWRHKLGKSPRIADKQIVRKQSSPRQKVTLVTSSPNKNAPQAMALRPQWNAADNDKDLLNIRILDNMKTRSEMLNIAERNGEDYSQLCDNELAMLLNIKKELNASMASPKLKEEKVPKASEDVDTIAANRIEVNEELDTGLMIANRFLCDYGPRLRQNYDIWQRNLSVDVSTVERNPLIWSTDETCRFIERTLGCTISAAACASEDIDGAALLQLHQTDLTDILHLKLGPATKLYAIILQLRILAMRKFNVKMATT